MEILFSNHFKQRVTERVKDIEEKVFYRKLNDKIHSIAYKKWGTYVIALEWYEICFKKMEKWFAATTVKKIWKKNKSHQHRERFYSPKKIREKYHKNHLEIYLQQSND